MNRLNAFQRARKRRFAAVTHVFYFEIRNVGECSLFLNTGLNDHNTIIT